MYEHFRHSSLYQNRPRRADLIINYSLPASKLGFISNFFHFPSIHVVEFTNSSSKLVGFALGANHFTFGGGGGGWGIMGDFEKNILQVHMR